MNNRQIEELIRKHYSSKVAIKYGIFSILEIRDFADGILCVRDRNSKDSKEEYSSYFNQDLWIFRHPEVWAGTIVFPPTLKRYNLGMLPGRGRAPQPRTFEEALQFAKQSLTRVPIRWYG